MEKGEFFYRSFWYDASVLTPRLETESLVREAIRIVSSQAIEVLIDVGTGTGIIPISIEQHASGIGRICGLEKSRRALRIARMNASRHGSSLNLIESDLLLALLGAPEAYDFSGKRILVTANLPYVRRGDEDSMSEDTAHEPKMALFGWKGTGFELYARFFGHIRRFKEVFHPGALTILCEIGYDQKDVAQRFLSRDFPRHRFFPDLRGIERFISIDG